MATLTVIVGYCGSGKTWWLRQKEHERPDAFFMNEGAQVFTDPPFGRLHDDVVAALTSGRDCFVGLMDCAQVGNRAALEGNLNASVPDTALAWVFYENDLAKANRNCLQDPERLDPHGNIAQNSRWSQQYDIPATATILAIHELPTSRGLGPDPGAS